MTTWADEVCKNCGGHAWVPAYITRQVDRYTGFFGTDEKPATSRWRIDAGQELVAVEVMDAEPCSYCNSKLHNALIEGRLLQAMKERSRPLTKEAQREANKARVKKEFDL